MEALEKLNQQINRELSCIDDLTAEIRILAHKLETDIAKQRKQDLHNSLEQLEKLRRRKELRSIAVELNLQGKKAKVVKKLAHQA